MERRFLVTGIILAICIIVITTIFLLRTRNHDNINPLKIIPQDAALIIKINGTNIPFSVQDENFKVWSDLSSLPAIAKINNDIKLIDSLINQHPKLFKPNTEEDFYISGHISPTAKISYLFIIPLTIKSGEKESIQLIQDYSKTKHIVFDKRKFENKTVYSLSSAAGMSHHFTFMNDLLLYSASPVVIEDAIRQQSLSTSLADNEELNAILNSVGKNKEANAFIDLNQAGKLFSLISEKEIKENPVFGSWVELDFTRKEDIIMLNGFTYIADTSNNFIKSITKGKPVQIEAANVLPANVSCFFSFGLSDAKQSYINYLSYLSETKKLATYKANLKNLNEKYDTDFSSFFIDLLSDEITLAYASNEEQTEDYYYILLKCKSGTEAEKAISELTHKIEKITNTNLSLTYSPDNSLNQKIFKLPIYPLFGRLIGNFFNKFEENYLTIVDNYIVVASSYNSATQFVNDFMLHKTLQNNETFRNYSVNLATKSYLMCYFNLVNSHRFFSQYLNQELIEGWVKNLEVFQKTQTLGFQISEVSGRPYFNLFLKHHEDYRGQPRTVWESLLDTSTHFKPKFLQNHYTKQNEIFIQDDKNNVYLINQSGRILWKLPISETINSEVYQIDYYNNGKLQILFSTENYIHLLDRNGNYTERYPVRLRAKSTAGLALFDYDSDKNYRIFIACDDKKTYMYSKEGTTISGWNFAGSDYIVTQPANHYRVSDKDFIIFGDKNYTYILDRKGDERLKLSESFSKSEYNNYYLFEQENSANSYFITTDTNGTICKIFLNGQVEKQKIKKFTSAHFFDFKDVNADGTPDYIFLDNNNLSVYKSNGELIFEKKFDGNITQRPVYYQFSYIDRKIGLVSDEKSTIYLLNNNGEQYKGFPLEGTTLFTIGYFDLTSSRFNLIVGGRNNFLYNYAVE